MSERIDRATAVVIGAERPFGLEIVRRLEADGFSVTATVDESDFPKAFGLGQLDAFVFNTPSTSDGIRFLDISPADFLGALEAQLFQVVSAGQAAAARLKPGGSIVHVGSRAHLGAWGGAHQAAAAAALVAMSRSMALELAAQGVRVNVVAADFVGEAWDTPEARTQIAATVAYLAGPDSKSISGETLLADQGQSLKMNESMKR